MTNPYRTPAVSDSGATSSQDALPKSPRRRILPPGALLAWLGFAGLLSAFYYSQYVIISGQESVSRFPWWLSLLLSALHVAWGAGVLAFAWLIFQKYRRDGWVLAGPGQWLILWMAATLFAELVASCDLILFGGTNFGLLRAVAFLPLVVSALAAFFCRGIWKVSFVTLLFPDLIYWISSGAWWTGMVGNMVHLLVLGFCTSSTWKQENDSMHWYGVVLMFAFLLLATARYALGLVVIGYLPPILGIQPL